MGNNDKTTTPPPALFAKEQERMTALEEFQKSFCITENENGDTCVSFSLISGEKGYGLQEWELDQLHDIIQVFKEAKQRKYEKYTPPKPNTTETIRRSLRVTEDEKIMVKGNPNKGARPTMAHNVKEFEEFATFIESNVGTILEYAVQHFGYEIKGDDKEQD